jgi:hypothetical protein
MRVGIALGALTLMACSAAPAVDTPTVPAAPIAIGDEPTQSPSAGWRYHPSEMGNIGAGWALPDGRWLLLGELGERWLTDPLDGKSKMYRARASAHRAPERISHLLRLSGRGWLFVDLSGGTYTATEPLGSLRLHPRAPRPLMGIAATRLDVLGVDALGALYRWSNDAWVRQQSGPAIHEIASGNDGVLLGVSFPEALRQSRDGRQWTTLDAPTFGAHALRRLPDGALSVIGAARSMRFERGALSDMSERAALPTDGGVDLRPAVGPRASAIEQDTATLADDRYVEVFSEGDDDHERWMLARAKLGQELAVAPLAIAGECDEVIVAAGGSHVLVACATQAEPIEVVIHRSRDFGKSFTRVAQLRATTPTNAAMAVSKDGVALLTGMCPVDDRCQSAAPWRLDESDRLTRTRATELTDGAYAPAYAYDGASAYFVGKRAKDGHDALFVSHDAGESFEARALTPPAGHIWDEHKARTLHPGTDGSVGIVLAGDAPAYALADADGQVVGAARLPEHTAAVSGSGRNVMALSEERQATGPSVVAMWESADGGASFRALSSPMRPLVDELERHFGLTCSAAGCIIGDRITRIGWNERTHYPTGRRDEGQPSAIPDVRTPIVCQLEGAWQQLDHIVGTPPLPPYSQMMRGRYAWSLLRHDDARGEVSVVGVALDDDGKLHTQRLFAPVQKRDRWAYHVTRQMEGYAAMRVPIPANGHADQPMRALEVAWVNHLADNAAHVTLRDGGTFVSDDVTPGARPLLLPGLLSVSPHAVFVRPSRKRSDTLVLDLDGQVLAQGSYPEWPATPHTHSYGDAVVGDGTPLAVAMYHQGGDNSTATTLGLAALSGGPTAFVSIAPADAPHRIVETSWTYAGDRVGVVSLLADPAGDASGWFAPFGPGTGLGPAIALPSQRDVPATGASCNLEAKRDTPRLNAPALPGTRHPILVHGDADTHVLLSVRATLHGTPDKACVAGWHAESVAGMPHTAVVSGDASRGWLFKSPAAGVVAYSAMSCVPSPTATIPPVVFTQGGTVRFE